MPLITITTKASYFPRDTSEGDTEPSWITAKLGEALPGLIAGNCKGLHLDAEKTSEGGVQVDYQQFHPRAVNAPDIWILIWFAEEAPSEQIRLQIRHRLRTIILRWFRENSINVENVGIAKDVFWGPGHGFLKIGDERLEW